MRFTTGAFFPAFTARYPRAERYVYVYVWADGLYLQARLDDEKPCILVLIGATPEGRKELIGFVLGARFNDGLEIANADPQPKAAA